MGFVACCESRHGACRAGCVYPPAYVPRKWISSAAILTKLPQSYSRGVNRHLRKGTWRHCRDLCDTHFFYCSPTSHDGNFKMRGHITIASWFCAASLSLAAPGSGFETVETENGRITGHRSPKNDDVWEYLGIPYAQPPLGDLRFAAPQKYKGKGPYTANEFVIAYLLPNSIEMVD
jgi:hypothetical protein